MNIKCRMITGEKRQISHAEEFQIIYADILSLRTLFMDHT